MDYLLRGHGYHHDVYTVIQLFFHNERYARVENVGAEGLVVESVVGGGRCYAALHKDGAEVLRGEERDASGLSEKKLRNLIKTTVFVLLREWTGYSAPWGALTGIRPTKKALELRKRGLSGAEIAGVFEDEYLASPKKARLCAEIAGAEAAILEKSGPKDVSLYIGIPFCPTRCLYCSFTSYPIAKYAAKAGTYIDRLIYELRYIARKIRDAGESLQSVYIGGGTPTSVDRALLERLLAAVAENFDLGTLEEYCCEAGRPDAIDAPKLETLKKYGVARISVNPQSMNARTLHKVGRAHGVADFRKAYAEAEAAGFDNINVDIILGLPDENLSDAAYTIKEILALGPASVTVHTLCVKRAADLRQELSGHKLADYETLGAALDLSYRLCKEAGLLPYYMYRQKNAIGNFENIGYARKGFECVYNIQIMEEKQTIYAAGAGAVSKFYYPESDRLVRAFNVKDVDEYISRTDEMIRRKEEAR